MKLMNFEIMSFIKFLMSLELSGKQSRMRTRFVKLIGERYKLVDDEAQQILDKYVQKNPDGSQVKEEIKDSTLVKYKLDDTDSYNKEYRELMFEEYVIDETDERRDMLLTVRDMVLNTDIKFSGDSALEYDRYCEIVETISYE